MTLVQELKQYIGKGKSLYDVVCFVEEYTKSETTIATKIVDKLLDEEYLSEAQGEVTYNG